MDKMGHSLAFTSMVRMLLIGASACISLNGLHIADFSICRVVRQGCPLAPYLFLLVVEALVTASHQAMDQGII